MTPGVYILSVIETDANGCVGLPITVDVTVNPLTNSNNCYKSNRMFWKFVIPDLTAVGSQMLPGILDAASNHSSWYR